MDRKRFMEVLGRCVAKKLRIRRRGPGDYVKLAEAWIQAVLPTEWQHDRDWACLPGDCTTDGWGYFHTLCRPESIPVVGRMKLAFLDPYPKRLYEALVELMGCWEFPHFPGDRLCLLSDWENLLGQARRRNWVKAHSVSRLFEVIDYHFELTKPDRENKFPFECCVLPWGQPYFHMAMDHTGVTGRELYEGAKKWPGESFFKDRYPNFFRENLLSLKTEADKIMGFYFCCSRHDKYQVGNDELKRLWGKCRFPFKDKFRL